MATNGWSKEKQDDKVCFKGDAEKGPLIIKELERLGGVNSSGLVGMIINYYYYINRDGEITYTSFIPNGYTLKSIEDIVTTSEEPLLEVGKWYTCNTWDKNSYAKFLSFENVKNYPRFHFSECIRGGEFRVKNDWWSVRGGSYNIREVSLEEIQQYLSEGHVDKLPAELNELPERWCVRGYEEVAKYSNKYGACPPYGKSTDLFHHYPCYAPGYTTAGKIKEGYVEITLEQFKKWVLKEPLKDKKQFEIGKWYKITNSTATYFVKVTKLRSDSLSGKFIVNGKYCDLEGGFALYDIKEQSLLTDLSEIQKYLPENHPDKIKKDESLIGKRIKALVDHPNSGVVKKGEIGVIYEKYKTFYIVNFPSQNSYSIPKSDIYNLTKYELLDNVEKVKHFQKGDYIVITKPGLNNDGFISDYCYKQRETHVYLSPELTTSGSRRNAWILIEFKADNWRYATKQEIDIYNGIGKPYDTKTLEKLPSRDIIEPIDCINNSKNLIFAKKKSKLLPFKKEEVVTVCLTTKNNKK